MEESFANLIPLRHFPDALYGGGREMYFHAVQNRNLVTIVALLLQCRRSLAAVLRASEMRHYAASIPGKRKGIGL